MGDLRGHAIAGQGVELADLGLVAPGPGAVEDGLGHAGFDQARADGVHAHARPVEVVGRRLGQVDHPGLGGRIGHAAGARADAGHRGGHDDGALAPRNHDPAGVLHRQEGSDQVDPQDLGPMVGVLLLARRGAARDAGVGPDGVQGAVLGDGPVHQPGHEGLLAGVPDQGDPGPAGLAHLPGGFFGGVELVGDDQLRALCGEQQGGGAANAGASARDDDGFSGKTSHDEAP